MTCAARDFEDAGCEAVDEVAVVRDEDHGSGEASDGVEQHVLGAEVEVIGRLVQQQEVGRAHEDLGQR